MKRYPTVPANKMKVNTASAFLRLWNGLFISLKVGQYLHFSHRLKRVSIHNIEIYHVHLVYGLTRREGHAAQWNF